MKKTAFILISAVLMTPFLYGITFQEKQQSATWYDNGLYLFDQGKYLKSVECLEKALSLDSDNEKAKSLMNKVIQMAKSDLNMKNSNESAEDTDKPRVRVYTDYTDSSRAKDYMNQVLVKNMKSDMKNNTTKYKHLEKYLTHAKGSKVEKEQISQKMNLAKAEDFNREGLEFAKSGKFNEAIAVFQKALELDPYNVESHVNLGLAYAYTDRLYDAIKEYKLVVKLADPKSKHYEIASSMIEKLKSFI